MLLAETHEPRTGAEAVVDPVEAQFPLIVVPNEGRDADVTARTTPNRSREYQSELSPILGKGVLLLKEALGMELAAVGVIAHGLGALDHHVAFDKQLTFFQKLGEAEDGLAHNFNVLNQFPTPILFFVVLKTGR